MDRNGGSSPRKTPCLSQPPPPSSPPSAAPHPSGKKLSIMRSPRGFTASAPICCKSMRLQSSKSNRVGTAKRAARENPGDKKRGVGSERQRSDVDSPHLRYPFLFLSRARNRWYRRSRLACETAEGRRWLGWNPAPRGAAGGWKVT